MKREEIVDIVEKFILELLNESNDNHLTNTTKLITTQVLDSLGVIQLVNFLESSFNITFKQSDLSIENLDDIDLITDYVYKKLK